MKKNSKDLTVGVNRNIDDLGRVVLHKEMRDKLNLKKNSPVSIKLFKDYIKIEKAITTCSFCSSEENIEYYKELPICKSCLNEIVEKFNK